MDPPQGDYRLRTDDILPSAKWLWPARLNKAALRVSQRDRVFSPDQFLSENLLFYNSVVCLGSLVLPFVLAGFQGQQQRQQVVTCILANKGQRRPSIEWSHLVNASGHWRLVTFSSLSNCSSEVQSKRPIILLPSYSEPRSSRAISLPMISLYVKHLKSWTGRPEQSMVLGLRTGNLKAIILPD